MSKKIKKNRVALNQLKKKLASLKKYLPIFEKQRAALNKMLQEEDAILARLTRERDQLRTDMAPWIAVFSDSEVDIGTLIAVTSMETTTENIFGTTIPVFVGVHFQETPLDIRRYPLWIPDGIAALRRVVEVEARMTVSTQRARQIRKGYEESNQKVNLFDKKLIPGTEAAMKEIKTALDAQGIASIVIAKSAKKLQERRGAA